MVQVVSKVQTITANTTLMPEGFGGWIAMNIGSADVKVDGFVLAQGDKLDLSHLGSEVVWNVPIQIEVATGGALRIMRLKYNTHNG